MFQSRPRRSQINLVLCAPTLTEVPWRDDLERLAAAAPRVRLDLRLTQLPPPPGWGGSTGRIDAATVAALVAEYGSSAHARPGGGPGARFYISGPPRMVTDLSALLAAAGVPADDVSVETFRGGAAYDAEADMQATASAP